LLKLFVLTIARLRSTALLALLIAVPVSVSRIDIALLALLRAAYQKDHQRRAVLPEIDPVSWSEIDSILKYACTDRFDVGKIPLLRPDDGARDLGARNSL